MVDPFVTLKDVKGFLNIALSDVTYDTVLQGLPGAASEACLQYGLKGHDPRRRTRTEITNGLGGAALTLRHFPIKAVTSVTVYPSTTAIPSDQIVFDDNCVYLRFGKFPRAIRNVTVVYNAGRDDLDDLLQQAVKYTVKAMYDARLTDMNSSGEAFNGVTSSTFWPTGPGFVPPQAMKLLAPYAEVYRVA